MGERGVVSGGREDFALRKLKMRMKRMMKNQRC